MKRKIIAVTACATGIAHTYMAAQALKKEAQKKGYLIKVETQGATGIDGRLTEKDCQIGEVAILAVDTKIRDEDRFKNNKILRVPVSAPIKNAEKVINDALALADNN